MESKINQQPNTAINTTFIKYNEKLYTDFINEFGMNEFIRSKFYNAIFLFIVNGNLSKIYNYRYQYQSAFM